MMARDNPLKSKSMAFAVRVVESARLIREEKREFALADQFLRSGTSIGANIAEAQYAASQRDFLCKCKIALKETSETMYWLELLENCGLLTAEQSDPLKKDCDELRLMLSSSCKTLEERINPK